jgi:hypothetical protein
MGSGMAILRDSGIVRNGDPIIELGTGVVFISCEFEIMECQWLIMGNRRDIPQKTAIFELGFDIAFLDSSFKGLEEGRGFD